MGLHSSFSKQFSTPTSQLLENSEHLLIMLEKKVKKSLIYQHADSYRVEIKCKLTRKTLSQPPFEILSDLKQIQNFPIGTHQRSGNEPE